MKHYFILLSFLVLSACSQPTSHNASQPSPIDGQETGGGFVVKSQTSDELLLLDLVEAGANPPYYEVLPIDTRLEKELVGAFQDLEVTEFQISLLAAKLNAISQKAPVLSTILKNLILSYRWSYKVQPITSSKDLKTIHAVESGLTTENTFQVAWRFDQDIVLDPTLLKRLRPDHFPALIIHEVLAPISEDPVRLRQRVASLFIPNGFARNEFPEVIKADFFDVVCKGLLQVPPTQVDIRQKDYIVGRLLFYTKENVLCYYDAIYSKRLLPSNL